MQIAVTSTARRQAYVAVVKTEHGLRCDDDDIVCFIAAKLEQLDVYPIFLSPDKSKQQKAALKNETQPVFSLHAAS